ncbi:unnamed protein product, partial [marine sediment metagenome]
QCYNGTAEGEEGKETFSLCSFEAAWEDILYTLKSTEPEFRNWKEAMKWVRGWARRLSTRISLLLIYAIKEIKFYLF